jgi:CubicO group peptidase (beta-lactamase class C family)
MFRSIARAVATLGLLALPCHALLAQGEGGLRCGGRAQWPGRSWPRSNPYAQAVDGGDLTAALDAAGSRLTGLNSVLVIRHGYIVAERYYHGFGPEDAFELASVTKSAIGVLVGRAIAEGRLRSVDLPITSLLPELARDSTDPLRRITLRHLLTMRSGIDWDLWRRRPGTFTAGMPPGQHFAYEGGDVELMAVALSRVTPMPLARFVDQQLFGPLGIPARRWRWVADSAGVVEGAFGLRLTTRDLARIGYLYLRDGCWDGRPLLPAGWVTESTTPWVTKTLEAPEGAAGFGYYWWVEPMAGHRAFYAAGYGGQYLVVVPDLDLVVTTTGSLDTPPSEFHRHLELVRDVIVPTMK